MNSDKQNKRNQAAFLKLKDEMERQFPPGQFIAIENRDIAGDAPSFEELDRELWAQGKDSRAILVVQAGVDYPEEVVIF